MSSSKLALMRMILYARAEAMEQGEVAAASRLAQASLELVDCSKRFAIAEQIGDLEIQFDELLLSAVESDRKSLS
jgi:hypothetical protein